LSLLVPSKSDPNVRLIALALATGVPFAAYLATASAHDYWLDGGELTAQAIQLDIAHPPGHPLAGLLGKLVSLIPLGPLSLRVALAQALCAALAAGFLFRAIDTTVRALGVDRDRVAVPIALGGTWLVAGSYAWWFQAVRPEVYALEALLVCVAIERVIALEAAWPTHDVRPLYVAMLALGLGLANHHLVAFLAIPAVAPTLARVYRARGVRPLLLSLAAIAVGLSAYVYLPVRAATDPPANLGDPTDPARIFWVVSARVYAHDMGSEAEQPLGERFVDVLVILGRNLAGGGAEGEPLGDVLRALFVLAVCLVSLFAILRTPGARRIGIVWMLVFGVNLGARAWLGSVRSNPDILGYMMPGFAAVGALGASLVASLLTRIGHRPDGTPRTTATIVALVVAVLGLAQMKASAEQASLASFHATDDFDEERIRRLPENAVVLAHNPQTVFRHWSIDATERVRPDVTIVPMPFLDYPGQIDLLVERDPDLRELLRGYMLEAELRQPDLQSLSASRPLLVEMMPPCMGVERGACIPFALYETLVPAGIYYEVVESGATDADVTEAAAPQEQTHRRLYAHLGHSSAEEQTHDQLLWMHYTDALYYAAVGAREPARSAVRRALRLQPHDRALLMLNEALADPAETGPMDITPFVVGAP
jgi:hypothetical protein